MADFRKTYLKEGLLMFSDSSVAMFRAIQHKYAKEYAPFFFQLADAYGNNTVSEGLANLGQASQQIVRDIGTVLKGTATKPDLDRLYENMDYINKQAEFYKKEIAKEPKETERLTKIEQGSGVSLQELSKTHGIVRKQVEGLQAPGAGFHPLAAVQKYTPGVYEAGAGLLGGLAHATVGPLADIGVGAFRAGRGIFRGIRQRRIAGQQQRLGLGLTPLAQRTPEGVLKNIRNLTQKTQLGNVFEGGAMLPQQHVRADRSTGIAIGAGVGGGMGVGALFTFFDKLAFKARWTRDVHDMLKKGGGKGGSGGMFGGLLGTLAKMLPLLVGAIGVTMGAVDAFKAVTGKTKEWFGVADDKKATLGQKMFAGIGGFLGGTHKGVGEKGATLKGTGLGILGGTAKGAAIGAGIGSIVPGIGTGIGAGIGAGVGALGSAIGGRRLALGTRAAFSATPLGALAGMVGGARRAKDTFGVDKATISQMLASGLGNVLTGLSFGKLDEVDQAKKIHSMFSGIKKAWSKMFGKEGDKKVIDAFMPEVKSMRGNLESVPNVATVNSSVVNQMSGIRDDIRSNLSDFIHEYKKSMPKDSTVSSMNTRDDIFNNRDPVLDGLNNGSITLE